MAIRRFTEDVNVISSLPDAPSPPQYNAAILKAKFDEAAVKIKSYINDELINDIEQTTIHGITAVRKLLVSYKTAGTFTFDTSEHPSAGGVYDVVLVGGGGGGSVSVSLAAAESTGGGSGGVTKKVGAVLDGVYSVTVGAPGRGDPDRGTAGGATIMNSDDYSFYEIALGGGASSQTSRIGRGGGIGGGDSVYADGTYFYGRGGDNEYGRGVRGGVSIETIIPAEGYGAGGWAGFTPTCGAVFIYGYERV